MRLNIESPVFIHRHLVQGAGIPVCSKLASQRTVVKGGTVQLERPVCAIQSTAVDRRVLQSDGLSACDDGTSVLNGVADQYQISSLRRDGARVGEVCINIASCVAACRNRQILAYRESTTVFRGSQIAGCAFAAQIQRASADQRYSRPCGRCVVKPPVVLHRDRAVDGDCSLCDGMSLKIESSVFIHGHMVQGAGLSRCQKIAGQCAIIDGGTVQSEKTVCTVQSTAIDRRILQGDGLPPRDNGADILDCVAIQRQVASLRRDGARVGEVCVDVASGIAEGCDRQILADCKSATIFRSSQIAGCTIAAQVQHAHAIQLKRSVTGIGQSTVVVHRYETIERKTVIYLQ